MAPTQLAGWRNKPSTEEKERRNTVGINLETVTHVTSTDYPGHVPGEDAAFTIDRFRDDFSVHFHQNEPSLASFSLVGLDASLANAFRRILISEIPTLAIENVYIENNTSVVQDEVLAHRLGLIPFNGSRDGIHNFLKWHKKPEAGEDPYAGCFDWNTVRLDLNVTCTVNKEAAADEPDPTKAYHNAHVYARDIVFVPTGKQAEYFSGENSIRPVNPDILIAKMRPRQTINLSMHMHKGIGADHAKFSPVATASYRLMPTIQILKPILGADAEKFARCFPEGVIGLDTVSKKEAGVPGSPYEGHAGEIKAVVKDAMKDTVSRECLRHHEFEGKVKLGRRRDHFIFSIESTGQWDSDELFLECIKHLKLKCKKLEQHVVNMAR
ncbi:DNA-directed RNA polymerases I and III 40 kDa polypeptide [Drechmeria coniospora]|uniref:DNA-directed RNA polymerases I and III subunit RPAC1 n=1 Tax=Drechmeria coniospora TaxID=98403 RepID=A0A151GID4_DRECN|nr:DNA-directed RNA polymerases I and III 40 kDa polypeptide [Drechmeria coniospora]KYK56860.1 DNA-directed RNA polymerases I and III 40 kDa polypeptide [Drechmeria coniospora]